MRLRALLSFGLPMLLAAGSPGLATTDLPGEYTVLLVRHAEKQSGGSNPNLSRDGLARASALASIAQQWGVTAILSTEFCRTAQTAAPAAQALGLPVALMTHPRSTGLEHCDPPVPGPIFTLDGENMAIAPHVATQPAGSTVLVVGHSNTVPEWIDELTGASSGVVVDESEYDRLFVVRLGQEIAADVSEYRYSGDQAAAANQAIVPESPPEAGARAEEPAPVRDLEIVTRSVAHHGGDLYANSRIGLVVSSRSGRYRVASEHRDTHFANTVETLGPDGQVERSVRVDNETAQSWEDGTWNTVTGDEAAATRDFVSARVYFPLLPYRLLDPSVWKEDQGLERWDDRELHRVKVTFDPGSSTDASDQYLYWFDPATGRLEQYAYSFLNDNGQGGLRFRRASNYRRVGGILFFDVDNRGVGGPGAWNVDSINPAFVEREMEPVSRVELTEISVEALP